MSGAVSGPGGADKLPPASFEVLVGLVAGPCFVHLGKAPSPVSGEIELDLEQAKWALDLLHVLEEKTRGNLDDRERAMVDHLLHELRSSYMSAKS